jgi:hypothetical protein
MQSALIKPHKPSYRHILYDFCGDGEFAAAGFGLFQSQIKTFLKKSA